VFHLDVQVAKFANPNSPVRQDLTAVRCIGGSQFATLYHAASSTLMIIICTVIV
jgi:hypothetical protein